MTVLESSKRGLALYSIEGKVLRKSLKSQFSYRQHIVI